MKPFVKRIEHIVNNALDFVDKSVTDKIVFPIDNDLPILTQMDGCGYYKNYEVVSVFKEDVQVFINARCVDDHEEEEIFYLSDLDHFSICLIADLIRATMTTETNDGVRG